MQPLTDDESETVAANRGLVWYCLERFNYPRQFRDDLESAGYLGLFRAVQVYDARKGKLSTIAIPWIHGYICTELRKLKSSVIHGALSWDDHKEQASAIPAPPHEAEMDDRLAPVLRALNDLKPIERAVVCSHVAGGIAARHVGHDLHMTKWAVLQIKSRAIRKIRKQLKLEGVDFS